MAKFSELLGSMAKDLVQLQVSSDISTKEVLPHYQGDEILKNFDIPRFTLSDVAVKIKFAISEEGTSLSPDIAEKFIESKWIEILKIEVLEKMLTRDIAMPFITKEKGNLDVNILIESVDKVDFDLINAINYKKNSTSLRSMGFILTCLRNSSIKSIQSLIKTADFKKKLKIIVTQVFDENIDSLRKISMAKTAIDRDVDVLVEKDALDKIDANRIHEISFKLTPDYVRFVKEEEEEEEEE